MNKCYSIEYEFEIEVVDITHNDSIEHSCNNSEKLGDKYHCTYGWAEKDKGYGLCSRTMVIMYRLMETIRSGKYSENFGEDGKYSRDIVCPSGCVMFRLTAKPLEIKGFNKDMDTI